jgi:hypothetical protein
VRNRNQEQENNGNNTFTNIAHCRPLLSPGDIPAFIVAVQSASHTLARLAPRYGVAFDGGTQIKNGAQSFLRDYFHLTLGELGFATRSAILGCVSGPPLGVGVIDSLFDRSALAGLGDLKYNTACPNCSPT